jgi:hypothetical protein
MLEHRIRIGSIVNHCHEFERIVAFSAGNGSDLSFQVRERRLRRNWPGSLEDPDTTSSARSRSLTRRPRLDLWIPDSRFAILDR